MATRWTTDTFTTASIDAGATLIINRPIDAVNIDIGLIAVLPSINSGTTTFGIYKRDTCLDSDMVYQNTKAGNLYDPIQRVGVTEQTRNEFLVAKYDDLDDSLELHCKITNTSADAKTYDVTIAYVKHSGAAETKSLTDFGADLAGSVSVIVALTAAEAEGKPLIIPYGTFKIDSNITISIPIIWQGGQFTSSNSSTLTLTGPQSGSDGQRFTGSLVVSFAGNYHISTVRPEYWGAKADGVIDSTAALNAASNSFPDITLSAGDYMTSGWTVGGFGRHIHGINGVHAAYANTLRSRVKAIGSQARVFGISGHSHLVEHVAFNGANVTTVAVVDLMVPSYQIRFENCAIEETLAGGASNLAQIDSSYGGVSIQGDTNQFVRCAFMQTGGVANAGLLIKGSNAFLNLVDLSFFYGTTYGVSINGGGAEIKRTQFAVVTSSVYYSQAGQPLTIEKCYQESSGGSANLLTMANMTVLGDSPIRLVDNRIRNGGGISLIPTQPIYLEGNDFVTGSLVAIGDPGVADYPMVVSINNHFSSANSYTGAKYDSVIRIGDTASAGTISYNLNIGQAFLGITKILVASAAFDPPSIADGGSYLLSYIALPGAALGDQVIVSAPYDTQGLVVYGYVKEADMVYVALANNTGSAIDLGLGTWKVKVIQ